MNLRVLIANTNGYSYYVGVKVVVGEETLSQEGGETQEMNGNMEINQEFRVTE